MQKTPTNRVIARIVLGAAGDREAKEAKEVAGKKTKSSSSVFSHLIVLRVLLKVENACVLELL